MSTKSSLMERFKDKEFRHAYIAARIKKDLPFQIKALRKKMGWSQHDLAVKTGMKQSRISLLENPNYEKGFRTETLLRVAAAFDVSLVVRFASFTEVADWVDKLSENTFAVPSFEQEQINTPPAALIETGREIGGTIYSVTVQTGYSITAQTGSATIQTGSVTVQGANVAANYAEAAFANAA